MNSLDHGLTAAQLAEIKRVLSPFAVGIEAVHLFGSRATATYKPYSDVDLVIYGTLSEAQIDRLHTLFRDSSLPYHVDIKAYAQTDYSPLRRHFDEVGQVLFSRQELQ